LAEGLYVFTGKLDELCCRLPAAEKLHGTMMRADCTYNPRRNALSWFGSDISKRISGALSQDITEIVKTMKIRFRTHVPNQYTVPVDCLGAL
jgi:hypothetical protein